MKKLIYFLITLWVALATAQLSAQITTYRVKDVPNVQLIDHTRFVSDPNDAIDEADEAVLNQRIDDLRDSLDVEIAIVVLPAIDGDKYGSAREFANELFNTWGIGKKGTDRGLLILLITNEDNREVTFETGYGLEGELTDGLCKLIQKRLMIPPMKEGRYGEGLLAGMVEVRKALVGESTFEADVMAQDEKETKDFVIKVCKIWWGIGAIVVIFLLLMQLTESWTSQSNAEIKETKHFCNSFVLGAGLLLCQFPLIPIYFLLKLLLWPLMRPRVKCKQCGAVGRFKLKEGYPKEEKVKKGTRRIYLYVCRNCGYEKQEKTFEEESSSSTTTRKRNDDRKSRSWWSSGSGGSSSSSSSSSSSGGSWGGGRSGGGGASSKF